MLLVVITMLMVTGTMNLHEIVQQQAGGFWNWHLIWQLPAFLTYFISATAEVSRTASTVCPNRAMAAL